MKDLLQRLWDEFAKVVGGISKATDDDPTDDDLLDTLIDDTDEMKKLRKDLFDAGIQNISGFEYYAKEPTDTADTESVPLI